MRIGRDRVGLLEPREERRELARQDRHGSVRSVDVKPERLAAAQLREGVQRVDRSGVDRPGGADDDRGGKARRPVLRDRALEEIQADPESLVGLDLAQVPGADPEQVDGLVACGHTAARRFLLRSFGDHGLGGDEKAGDRCCVLQGDAHDLGGPRRVSSRGISRHASSLKGETMRTLDLSWPETPRLAAK